MSKTLVTGNGKQRNNGHVNPELTEEGRKALREQWWQEDADAQHWEQRANQAPIDVLLSVVERLDQVFNECAGKFYLGLDGSDGAWSKGPWLHEFVNSLTPWQVSLEKRILTVLVEARDPNDKIRHDIDSDYHAVKGSQIDAAYLVGVLAGARLGGFTQDRLIRLASTLADEIH
jgi:hypothetical protein